MRVPRTDRALSLVTVAVFAWLTVVGCLACCLVSPADPCGASLESDSHACCSLNDREAANAPVDPVFEAANATPQSARLCPILANAPGPYDIARAVNLPAALPASTPPISSAGPATPTRPGAGESFVANRGDTYIRCRVLLI